MVAQPESWPWTLSVVVRLERGGPEATREPVTDEDLFDARAEAWLAGVLREGRADVALDDVETRVQPVWSDRRACIGYTLVTVDPRGHTARREFTLRSLEAVASRAAQRLIDGGRLSNGALYYYDLLPEKRPPARPVRSQSQGLETRPLEPLVAPIGPLLERARAVGPEEDGRSCPVFFTEEALARAEQFARKGARSHPPTESGAVLIGPPASCPETGEMYLVVEDVLEATDAEQREFSLYYSGKTWARIQAVMAARQAQPATRSQRILGQCHGHNFLPADGAPPCAVCHKVPVCGRTSVFISQDDLNWSRAVFRRQPWHLCQIFGVNARRENVQGLFGLRDGRLQERGFHVIPDFDVEGR